jgi:hypothetical protein
MFLFSFRLLEFYRQGCYSDEGDIVVLCAYLGQLARLRDALASEVAIVIDERDQAALDDQEGDNDDDFGPNIMVEHVKVAKRVSIVLLLLVGFKVSFRSGFVQLITTKEKRAG